MTRNVFIKVFGHFGGCAFCHGANFTILEIWSDEAQRTETKRCSDCGTEWDETYNLRPICTIITKQVDK